MMGRLGSGVVLVGFLLLSRGASPARAEAVSVDAVHSSVLFRIKHLNTSHAWGRFNDVAGKLNLDDGNPLVEVQIKTASIDTGNPKREEHLKSPDFFNAKQFPAITFRSTRVQKSGDGKYAVDGKLNLHGVEKPIRVELTRTGAGKNQQGTSIVGYETNFIIKRSDFGMKYLLEGLSDDVLLIVSLECGAK